MSGPEGSIDRPTELTEARNSEIKGIFEGLLMELKAEIDDVGRLSGGNVTVQHGQIRRKDWEIERLEKMERRVRSVGNRALGILGMEPLPKEE